MAGIALLLDLLKKSHGLSTQSVHSHGFFSATVAASAAAASVAAGRPFASRAFFGGGISVAYCDAGAASGVDYIPILDTSPKDLLYHDSVPYEAKEYPIELKPLFSAFGIKSIAVTSLRSFLLFYLPLLEPQPPAEDDDDFLQETPEERPVDLVTPFKKSLKQIARETTIVTIRRMLERLAVHYFSQRMAWKLLKDIPKSAKRKSLRGMPGPLFVYSVSKTTFRGHLLGVAASWIVQIGLDIYRCFFRKVENGIELVDNRTRIKLLRNKVFGATVKCCASLVFASIGAGMGALIHPSTGQWIGCALGDFAGPVVAIVVLEKLHMEI